MPLGRKLLARFKLLMMGPETTSLETTCLGEIPKKSGLKAYRNGHETFLLNNLYTKHCIYTMVNEHDINDMAADQGLRFNEGKPQWRLLPQSALVPMVRVLEFGATKYSPENWKKGLSTTGCMESLKRHWDAMMEGETHDPESGLPHIGHIMCNAMFISWMQANKPEFDDLKKENKKNDPSYLAPGTVSPNGSVPNPGSFYQVFPGIQLQYHRK